MERRVFRSLSEIVWRFSKSPVSRDEVDEPGVCDRELAISAQRPIADSTCVERAGPSGSG